MTEKKFIIHPEKKFEIKKVIYSDSAFISSIDPIEQGGIRVEEADDLENLVEAPLLEACKILHSKGIETVFSSANRKDISQGYVYITINFENLSNKNKEIALTYGEVGKIHGPVERKGIYLKIPITEKSTVGDIKRESIKIAQNFEEQ